VTGTITTIPLSDNALGSCYLHIYYFVLSRIECMDDLSLQFYGYQLHYFIVSTITISCLSRCHRLINKYLVIKEIGRGTSGDVYLCKNEENGQFAAMKVISRSVTAVMLLLI